MARFDTSPGDAWLSDTIDCWISELTSLVVAVRNLEMISAGLTRVMDQLESMAGEWSRDSYGQADLAVQSALQRMNDLVMLQNQEFNEIFASIARTSDRPSKADDERCKALAARMNFGHVDHRRIIDFPPVIAPVHRSPDDGAECYVRATSPDEPAAPDYDSKPCSGSKREPTNQWRG